MPDDKLKALITAVTRLQSVLVAYSGGVDSTFLLKAVQLSGIPAMAVTVNSETTPQQDLSDAVRLARVIGVEHMVLESSDLSDERFAKNPPNRCFYCKDRLFKTLKHIAAQRGLLHVVDGSNLDDLDDYRPGREAAQRHGVKSPLQGAGFGKADIRAASLSLGLDTHDKPSSPCLSSRFPFGTRITREALGMVAAAEAALRGMGFAELRVRHLGDTARVELGDADMRRLLAPPLRAEAVAALQAAGYRYVSLDLEGFKSGKLNPRKVKQQKISLKI